MGANRMRANGTHFFNNRRIPIKISRIPTSGRTYLDAESDFIKLEAPSSSSGKGIKLKSINLFNPKNNRIRASIKLRILVKVEFIGDGFELLKYSKKRNTATFG